MTDDEIPTSVSDAASEIASALSEVRIGHGRLGSQHGSARHGHHHGRRRHGHRGDGRRFFGSRGGAALRMLIAIYESHDPVGVVDIGLLIGVDQPRASRLVAQGVEEGLLARVPDPLDGRRLHVKLTPEGTELVELTKKKRRESVLAALEGFSDEEAVELARLLNRFVQNWKRGN